jgi:hypothetical protein
MNTEDAFRWIAVYALWALSVAVGFGLLLISREAFFIAYDVLGLHEFTRVALDKFLFLFASLAVVAVVVYLEHYYRVGMENRQLLERFFRATGIELLVIFGLQAFMEIAIGGGGRVPLRGLIAIELVVGIVFLLIAGRRKRRRTERSQDSGEESQDVHRENVGN